MTTRHLLPSALCALLASAASVPGLAAEPTDGTATFKVTTGATIVGSHGAHTVTWDCQDVAGKPVPDGEYRIRVEFTAAHEQGPLTAAAHIRFTKGPAAATVTPANLTNFKTMSLEFKPVLPPLLTFLRGDTNRSGVVDISDAVFALEYLFLGAVAPVCMSASDANDDAVVDLADPVAILHALYLGGTTLPPPGAACGSDPTADSLGCKTSGC